MIFFIFNVAYYTCLQICRIFVEFICNKNIRRIEFTFKSRALSLSFEVDFSREPIFFWVGYVDKYVEVLTCRVVSDSKH